MNDILSSRTSLKSIVSKEQKALQQEIDVLELHVCDGERTMEEINNLIGYAHSLKRKIQRQRNEFVHPVMQYLDKISNEYKTQAEQVLNLIGDLENKITVNGAINGE